MPVTLAARFATTLTGLLGQDHGAQLGVAVSGGSDSTALLHLAADWGQRVGCRVHAVTLDHGVRPDAAAEAAQVARQCQGLGLCHDTLHWTAPGGGNFQDQARRARYGLIAEWAQNNGISHVALGHTRDDQAETVLLRLLRGSGVDGLSAMAERRQSHGISWLRPVLGVDRGALRDYLRENNIKWSDDPSNLELKYDRVKARKVLQTLKEIGFSAPDLAETAQRMGSARRVLEQAAQGALKKLATVQAGSVILPRCGFFALPDETRRRILVHILCWIATEYYPPRHAALLGLERALAAGTTSTLHGCLISIKKNQLIFSREPAAVADEIAQTPKIWDHRWRLTGTKFPGGVIRMTWVKGLKSCPNWRETGLDRATVLAAPAIWEGARLVAAPVAGLANGWAAELVHNEADFHAAIISH